MRTFLALSTASIATLRLGPNSDILIARSTDAADTQDVAILGYDTTTPTPVEATSSITLTGEIEVGTSESWSSLTRLALESAATGAISFLRPGTKAGGYFAFTSQPANNAQIIVGITGHERTYTFKSTLSGAANEVLIGLTYRYTVRNLIRAMRAGTGAGSEYGTGTVAHEHLEAFGDSAYTDTDPSPTDPNTTTVYFRDRLGCLRQLGWSITAVTGITGLAPVGGVDGDLICEIAPAQLGAGALLTLDSADTTNLPSAYLCTFDAIQTFGRTARLWLQKDSGGGAAVDFSIRGGPDVDHLLELDTVSTNGSTIVASGALQGCEFVQVAITSNDDGGAVYAALVF